MDDSKITFATTPSTFHALAAQADNGSGVATSTSPPQQWQLYLDGDLRELNSADSLNDVQFADHISYISQRQ